jgi:hypothetical protein
VIKQLRIEELEVGTLRVRELEVGSERRPPGPAAGPAAAGTAAGGADEPLPPGAEPPLGPPD